MSRRGPPGLCHYSPIMIGTGKHPRRRLLAVGAVLIPAGLSSGAYLLADRPPSCAGGDLTIKVAAAPDIAPALGEIAARFDVQFHEVGDRCVRVAVQTRDPAQVAAALERRTPAGVDAWVPDSSIWPAEAEARGAKAGVRGTFVAVSPLVLATPRPVAAALRKARLYGTWRALLPRSRAPAATPGRRRARGTAAGGRQTARTAAGGRRAGRIAPDAARPAPRVAAQALDPAGNAGGAAATLAVQAALGARAATVRITRAPDPARLFATLAETSRAGGPMLIAAEQPVAAYNAAHPQDQVEIITPKEGTLLLDHPLDVLTTDPRRTQAVDAFRWTLLAQSAGDILQRYGFRTPDGRIDPADAHRLGLTPAPPRLLPHPSPAQIATALRG